MEHAGPSLDAALERYSALRTQKFANVPQVTRATLAEWQAAGTPRVVLCDVRTAEEFAVATLRGAKTRAAVEAEAGELKAEKAKVVVFCTLGVRSAAAVEAFRASGLDAYNLEGSLLAASFAPERLVDPKTNVPASRIHVFSNDWALHDSSRYKAVVFEKRLERAKAGFGFVRDKLKSWFL